LRCEVEAQRIDLRAGYYCSPEHRPRLNDEQRAFFEAVVAADERAPLDPVPLSAITAALQRARVKGVEHAFDALVVSGALVTIGAHVYRRAQIDEIRRRLGAALAGDRTITPAQFRDALATTRKYALPLLEWFDATGVTVRDGDVRRLRGEAGPASAEPA
jgi:selenocysteine-specific elongation factor